MLIKLLAALVLAVYACESQLIPNTGLRRVRPWGTILTRDGLVFGQHETVDLFRSHLSFKGIPYAAPPVGDLRFRAPVRPQAWNGIRNAFNHGNNCPQLALLTNRISGNEDCLFLNVYTPVNIRRRLPVMVNIHGGAFIFGSGDTNNIGPELLISEEIVYVSINYRLDVLGFLNTQDQNAPGNNGLKDVILALHWIQENILSFGGNPDDVTIMGVSAGAAIVHAMVLSEQARGLFHKALSHSGALSNTWGLNYNPLASVNQLIRNLQLNPTSNAHLLLQLREVSVERLLRAAINEDVNVVAGSLPFGPTIDAVSSLEPRILTGSPIQMISAGNTNRVPYMIGFNGAESIYSMNTAMNEPSFFETINQNPHLLVPREWNVAPNSIAANDIIDSIRDTYFFGQSNLQPWLAWDWSKYASDREFIFGISQAANWHAAIQPTYYFRFSYRGALSMVQRGLGLNIYPGASHADDAFYLNRINVGVAPALPSNHAFVISRIMVRLWSNFAKYGNPTPTIFDPVIENTMWPLMTPANHEYLEIGPWFGNNLRNSTRPFQNRLDMWQRLNQQYNSQ